MNRYQENILKYANVMTSTKDIAKVTKQEELKVQSTILTLARKGFLNKDKAKSLLKDTKMVKWVDEPVKGGLSKPLDLPNDRYKRVSA